jgi:putative hemolysin
MTPATAADGHFDELRAGALGVRLAQSAAEIDAAQALRYAVFYDEMGAIPSPAAQSARRDTDRFDAVADHLVVLDHTDPAPRVVATYRMIDKAAAARIGQFYSADEYDIAPLLAFPGNVLEVGRSCVHPAYRGRQAMQLLWSGIAAYVARRRIDVLFGCASLHGTDPDRIAAELTYLHSHHLAPPELRPRALPARYVEMQRMDPAQLDARRVLVRLPPLIKGYLRLGGWVGDGAVIDAQFNTTDVAIVVRTDLVTARYLHHYTRPAAADEPAGDDP